MLQRNWSAYIKDLDRVDKDLERSRTVFIGATPYTRIVPSFFMKNYEILCLKDCKEIDYLRQYADIYCLEREFPDTIDQIKSTTELVKNRYFLQHLKQSGRRFSVLLYMLGGALQNELRQKGIHYLANHPMIARGVLYKGNFRKLLKQLKLPTLPDKLFPKGDFMSLDYQDLVKEFGPSFVCQRGDYDTGGQRGTFFVHQQNDFELVKNNFTAEGNFKTVQLSKFIKGNSLSMIGCVTESGILCSGLQTQLVDIPEVLDGEEALGQFLGHDWGNRDYSHEAVIQAEAVIKTLGRHLYEKKYRGIFGVDFMYDPKTPAAIYPIECNPRFTGSFPLISLLQMQKRLPPFELFHILEHKKIKYEAEVDVLNKLYKDLPPQSNIYVGAHNVSRMPVELESGVYVFNDQGDISYKRPGAFPWQLKNEFEFLVIDNIFFKNYPLMQDVSRLFRLIFPRRISETSNQLQPLFRHIVKSFTHLI